MCSRPRDEAGRFLPATNIRNDDSSQKFLPVPTPNSNPAEDSRIARPVDDDFDARFRASVTRALTPMFDQILNRLEAMDARIAARYNSTSPARDLSSPPRYSESAYIDRRQHVDARIQRHPKQHVAPTPEPTSTSAEPSPRRTESSETVAEDVPLSLLVLRSGHSPCVTRPCSGYSRWGGDTTQKSSPRTSTDKRCVKHSTYSTDQSIRNTNLCGGSHG
jgi:hypothetical protein